MLIESLLLAIEIVMNYRPATIVQCGHDVLWLCDYDVLEEMTEEDRNWFERNNWYNDYDSLAHST